MGKEWRVFYISGTSNDHSDAPYDIWAELHREPGTPELRTDVYFPATDDVGVKLRNSTTLEIKVRQKRKKRGVEIWRKIIVGTHHGDIWQLDGEQFEALLKAGDHLRGESAPQLRDVIARFKACKPKPINVSKRRTQQYVDGVLVEQTDLRIAAKDQVEQLYRTLCLEDAPPPRLYALAERLRLPERLVARVRFLACAEHRACPQPAGLACIAMGYPAFLCRLAASLTPPPAVPLPLASASAPAAAASWDPAPAPAQRLS